MIQLTNNDDELDSKERVTKLNKKQNISEKTLHVSQKVSSIFLLALDTKIMSMFIRFERNDRTIKSPDSVMICSLYNDS